MASESALSIRCSEFGDSFLKQYISRFKPQALYFLKNWKIADELKKYFDPSVNPDNTNYVEDPNFQLFADAIKTWISILKVYQNDEDHFEIVLNFVRTQFGWVYNELEFMIVVLDDDKFNMLTIHKLTGNVYVENRPSRESKNA